MRPPAESVRLGENPQLLSSLQGSNPIESTLPMKTFEQITDLIAAVFTGDLQPVSHCLDAGEGRFLYDLEDKCYLDLVSRDVYANNARWKRRIESLAAHQFEH